MSKTTEIEKQNLEAHVELCAQRYEALEVRLDSIENKVSGLQTSIETHHQGLTKLLMKIAGTIIVAAGSIIWTLLRFGPQ